ECRAVADLRTVMRIGVVGTNWGLMHVGAFRAAGAEVVALCGEDAEKTKHLAAREGIPLGTDDVRTLCAAVDVVVVASPAHLHGAHVEVALGAGRHVLCEKPLTPRGETAQRLAAHAKASGRVCAVNFPYRLLPPLAALKGWLEARQVRHLVATVRNHLASREVPAVDGGLLGASGDLGGVSHVVDAALWLSGEVPAWVEAVLSGRPVHTAALHVGLSGGGVVTLTHVACPEPGVHGGWSLVGEDWEAGFAAAYVPARGGWCVSPVRVFEHGGWRTLAEGVEPREGVHEPWAAAHIEAARRFLTAARGGTRGPLATFAEGARVQQVLSAAVASEEAGRRVTLDAPPHLPSSTGGQRALGT
ncbi:MAG: Gfo/Idh/MocA family oxidoreductase, partial [Myxococcaceae bacterium]|nr:Gfo/Idh/MocA family oxidoreductase [Myxococcaceae bacterium]